MGGAQSQGRHGGIDHVRTGFDALEEAHGGQAGGVVGVELDGDLHRFLDGFHQVVGAVGGQQRGHILDADGVRADGLDLFGVVHVILVGEGVAGGVGDGDLGVAALFFRRFHSGFQVPDVV